MADVMEQRAPWVGRIMAQARLRELQCPLVWTTAATFDGVLEDKLRDLVTLAPSTWDAIVREIVRVSRMVHTASGSLDDIKVTLSRCYALVGGRGAVCPILAAYRPALMHVLDSTFVTVVCVFERKNLIDVPASEHIVKFEHLDGRNRAAVWAIRAQVKLTCYLGLPAGGQSTALQDALLAASRAKDMHPGEGQWKALYGDLLPDDNPRKLTLLRKAVECRRTPFTVTCLSRYLYKLGDNAAFDLCAEALVEWPRSVHANVSYVTMYLSCAAEGKLSRCLAEQCLHRLQRLTPTCVFVAGLALELRLRTAEERGAGDGRPVSRVARRKPFEPVDHAAIKKAMELYCPPEGPWTMVTRDQAGSLRLDECNCVCSGYCAYLTYKAHGTLLVSETHPLACYSE